MNLFAKKKKKDWTLSVTDSFYQGFSLMQCSSSAEYVWGNKDNSHPHYYVGLKDSGLKVFEILNSMTLIENYDHTLLFLENSLLSGDDLIVPPYDILIVLLTLVTVSPHYKGYTLDGNDTYNTTRVPLNRRAIGIFENYISILEEFDTTKYKSYDLEFLRCQLFLAIDLLVVKLNLHKKGQSTFQDSFIRHIGQGDTLDEPLPNYYSSYLHVLNKDLNILGNRLLTDVIQSRIKLRSMILWTLSNLESVETGNYLASSEIWVPVFNIIFRILGLRHDYFINFEMDDIFKNRKNKPERNTIRNSLVLSKNKDDKALILDILCDSPISIFFNSLIDSTREPTSFAVRFWERIFYNCGGINGVSDFIVQVKNTYKDETKIDDIFIPRYSYSDTFKKMKSIQFRKHILKLYFKLCQNIPSGRRLSIPAIKPDIIIDYFPRIFSKIQDPLCFAMFFQNDINGNDKFEESYYFSLLAERTLQEILNLLSSEMGQNYQVILSFVADISLENEFLEDIQELLETGFVTMSDKALQSADKVMLAVRAIICLLFLVQQFVSLQPSFADQSKSLISEILKLAKDTDSQRLHNLGHLMKEEEVPLLLPRLSEILQDTLDCIEL